MKAELGYNYLDTRYTGRCNNALSGISDFPFVKGDQGTATTLNQLEGIGLVDPPREKH